MKIRLVSHASLILDCGDCRIWTDPWLSGKVFNESWSLLGPVAFAPADLDAIDYLWISHEHPDHFHPATLRELPERFKRRVTVLFQQNSSRKMFRAFEKLGFPNHRPLPHREIVRLREGTEVYCYQSLPMDSALGVRAAGRCVVNVNDAELSVRDCRTIRRDFGAPDVVLNQFSIAGYAGLADRDQHLPALARRVLESLSSNHRELGAGCTLPIASFVYFSSEDNRYVNAYANTPRRAAQYLAERDQASAVLFPGDELSVGEPWDSTAALARWDAVYAGLDALPYDPPAHRSLDDLEAAFRRCAADLAEKYPRWLRRRLAPLTVHVPDLAVMLRLGLAEGRFEVLEGADPAEAELVVNAQPLWLVFAQPFGMQTLGVSARLWVREGERSTRNWRFHRILFALYNAELYLRARQLFSAANLRFLRAHLGGGLQQVVYRLGLMR